MIFRQRTLRHCIAACLIALLLMPAMALCAKIVTYTFAGEVGAIAGELPIVPGAAMRGSISFYSGAELFPPLGDDDNFWAYHPTGILNLAIGEHIWSNAQPGGKPCAVWMHIGWPQATFWCPQLQSDFGQNGMRLDFWIESGGPTTINEPYPLGPFDPIDFKTMRIGGQLHLSGSEGWLYIGDPELTDVQFTSEPGVIGLMLIIAFALRWFTR